MPPYKTEGENQGIRNTMYKYQITQKELAEQLGVHPQNVSAMIREKQMSIKQAKRYLNAIKEIAVAKGIKEIING